MNILFLHPYFDEPGGAENVIIDIAQHFSVAPHKAQIATAYITPKFNKTISVSIVQLSKIRSFAHLYYNPVEWLIIIWRLIPLIRRADIIVANNYPTNIWLAIAKIFCKRTSIWFCQEANRLIHPDFQDFPIKQKAKSVVFAIKKVIKGYLNKVLAGLDVWAAAKMNLVLFNSYFSKREFSPLFSGSKTDVCLLGTQIVKRSTSNRQSAKSNRILCIGRLHPSKNHLACMQAFALASKDSLLKGWELHICGDGPDYDYLCQKAKEMGLQDLIKIQGYVSDDKILEYLEDSSIFISLPYKEPFGLVFIQAFAFQLPCIGPSEGGPVEIIENGRTGFLVDPRDIKTAAQCLRKLCADSDLRRRMGLQAYARYQDTFSFESYLLRLRNCLGEKIFIA